MGGEGAGEIVTEKTYAPGNSPFDGNYTMYPDNAVAVDVSSVDQIFAQASTIYVGGAGNVVVTPWGGGSNVTFAMQAGTNVPVRVSKVLHTSTTATSMIAVY